ncbi:helix-turn-helix transcriptional regulator [Dethiosulfovibrio salsuginis]|uniref:Transcriptional regulator, AlpA family n=1 Tax=Dethiosulfovibrio salsuginis TaxID=561720 RepID=A0A1X7JI84_9BACT|nr:AlpA family phage regulatory protein [Dethiosulfovibrio salsuginis]SMG27811.1 transcriptional regulator, AlpA family [Dethiosulfovibrio salsuginis]
MSLEQAIADRIVEEAVPRITAEIERKMQEQLNLRREPFLDRLIDAKEAAMLCGIKRGTWYDLVKDGFAPKAISLSETLKRWSLSEVMGYIKQRQDLRERAVC